MARPIPRLAPVTRAFLPVIPRSSSKDGLMRPMVRQSAARAAAERRYETSFSPKAASISCRLRRSEGSASVSAWPAAPLRPVRPTRCT